MVFLTGGTGLLGMRLLYDLLVMGKSVRALCRESSDLEMVNQVLDFYHDADTTDLCSQLTWVTGDVRDQGRMIELLEDCEQCVHAAAMVSFHPADRDEMIDININGTSSLVDACLLYPDIRMLYISSVASLGRENEHATIDEQVIWKDSPYNTHYAMTKYHAEMEVWRGIEEGLNAVMVNPSIILGAAPVHRSSGTLFGAVLDGLKWYTQGSAAVVDVRDVSAMSIALLDKPVQGERFVLSAETISYQKLFASIARQLDKPEPHRHASPWLMAIAWRAAWLKDKIFRSQSPITRETVMSSSNNYIYKSDKIKAFLGQEFFSAEASLSYHAGFFLK